MSDDEHRKLGELLNSVEGNVALSNYDCSLLDELYRPPKWRKHKCERRTNHSTKGKRVEALWMNYSAPGTG
jgi:DNA adenine methylase